MTVEALKWGRGFAMWCARNLQRGGTEHIADSENQSTANAVRRAIREAGGRMKQIKLDFDRDGVVVLPGPSWIET